MREDKLAKSGTLRNTRNSTFQNLFEDRLNRMSGKRDIVQVTIDADDAGAPNENIVQNHLNIIFLNVF